MEDGLYGDRADLPRKVDAILVHYKFLFVMIQWALVGQLIKIFLLVIDSIRIEAYPGGSGTNEKDRNYD